MNKEEKRAIEKFRKLGIKKFREEKLTNEDLPSYFEFVIILNLIEKLQKENEELRKELNEENKKCMMLAVEKQDYFEKYKYHLQQNESLTRKFSNDIQVQKVKDKIEKLQKGPLKINENNKYYYETEAYNKIIIQVLQELIEREE